MIKIINVFSAILLGVLVILIISQRFYPISQLEIIYQRKFYIALGYLVLRLSRIILLRKEQKNGKLSE